MKYTLFALIIGAMASTSYAKSHTKTHYSHHSSGDYSSSYQRTTYGTPSANYSGAYVGVDAGFGWTGGISSIDRYGYYWSNSTFGVNVNAGYYFNQYLAVEGDLTMFAPANTTDLFAIAAVRGNLPLTDWFSLYGKAGLGINYVRYDLDYDYLGDHYHYSDSGSSAAVLLGVGVSFNLSQRFNLNIENKWFLLSSSNINLGSTGLLSVGVEYHF